MELADGDGAPRPTPEDETLGMDDRVLKAAHGPDPTMDDARLAGASLFTPDLYVAFPPDTRGVTPSGASTSVKATTDVTNSGPYASVFSRVFVT